MTEAQSEEHDALNQPIAQLMSIAEKRPLTQAEFLRLMSLLTTQRIISNGLAQLRFEEVWPAIRSCTPEESVIKGLSAPKLLELRQLVRQLVLDQGRKVVDLQPVAADAPPGALGRDATCWPSGASAPGSSPAPRGRGGGPRTSSSSTTTRSSGCSSPATPAASGSTSSTPRTA